jgi:hypothetical protein
MPDRPMRWKLLIAASLLASVAGAGACLLVAYLWLGSAPEVGPGGGAAAAVFVIPVGAVAAASVFVYRHTARRRSLQAAATALLASLLTLSALLAGSLYLRRPAPYAPPAESSAPVD